MEKITITGKGPKALKLGDGRFVGVRNPVTLSQFERGNSYNVEIETTDKGGRSYHDIVKVEVSQAPATAPAAAPAAKAAPEAGSYKARDYDAEARGKTRCAMYEAALQSPVVANLVMAVNGLDKALEVVKKAADAGYEYVFPTEAK